MEDPSADLNAKRIGAMDGVGDGRVEALVEQQVAAVALGHEETEIAASDPRDERRFVVAPRAAQFRDDGGFPLNRPAGGSAAQRGSGG